MGLCKSASLTTDLVSAGALQTSHLAVAVHNMLQGSAQALFEPLPDSYCSVTDCAFDSYIGLCYLWCRDPRNDRETEA